MPGRCPKPVRCCGCWPASPTRRSPIELLLHPDTLAASAPLRDITGSRLWQALKALDDFGLIDLDTSGQGPAVIPVARLHPLVRDTSRPAAGPDRLAFLELAARLLAGQQMPKETGLPEDPPMWPVWQLLVPHSAWSSTASHRSRTVRTTRWRRQHMLRT